ncbi:MAG: hypothetical protein AAGG50_03805 [Bacteroidota bacterium]
MIFYLLRVAAAWLRSRSTRATTPPRRHYGALGNLTLNEAMEQARICADPREHDLHECRRDRTIRVSTSPGSARLEHITVCDICAPSYAGYYSGASPDLNEREVDLYHANALCE